MAVAAARYRRNCFSRHGAGTVPNTKRMASAGICGALLEVEHSQGSCSCSVLVLLAWIDDGGEAQREN